MQTVTYKSNEARLKWRSMMDNALVGKQVVIERYDTPVAVLVNYERWKLFEQSFLEMLQERSREIDDGKYVLFEEVEKELRTQGIIP